MQELLELRNAQRGSPLDSNPTFRDLIDAGLVKVRPDVTLTAAGRNFTLDTKTWLTGAIPDFFSDNTAPPTPTGLVVTTSGSNTVLYWDDISSDDSYSKTLVYRAEHNNLSLAVQIGDSAGGTFLDRLAPAGVVYYYWIRHLSKAGLYSAFNDVNGASSVDTPDTTTLSYDFVGQDVVLSWPTPTSNLTIQYYVVVHGASFESGTLVGISNTNTMRLHVDYLTRQYWVAAVDVAGTFGTAGTVTVVVAPPAAPSITYSINGSDVEVDWSDSTPGSLPITGYELRHGSTWAGATFDAQMSTTVWKSNVSWTGNRTFLVAAIDTAGNYGSPASVTVEVTPPSATTLTYEVIDNNVLLYWTDSKQTLPIAGYELRRGVDVIGTLNGLFTVVFETTSGSYTYWVSALDTAGNAGTPVSVTVQVSQPPDYVLLNNYVSPLMGDNVTTINLFRDDLVGLIGPVDINESYSTHFTTTGYSRPWTTWADANAGVSGDDLYVFPTPTTAYYEEDIYYGAADISSMITLDIDCTILAGVPTLTPTISISTNGTVWTAYTAGLTQIYSSAFKYVRVRLDIASSGGDDLLRINGIQVRLDKKMKTLSGSVSCNDTDTGGTVVYVTDDGTSGGNPFFIDVTSITLTPKIIGGQTALTAIYDFTDTQYPTSFKALIYNAAGTRMDGECSWVVRGF
jgi:hypothetical protein